MYVFVYVSVCISLVYMSTCICPAAAEEHNCVCVSCIPQVIASSQGAGGEQRRDLSLVSALSLDSGRRSHPSKLETIVPTHTGGVGVRHATMEESNYMITTHSVQRAGGRSEGEEKGEGEDKGVVQRYVRWVLLLDGLWRECEVTRATRGELHTYLLFRYFPTVI